MESCRMRPLASGFFCLARCFWGSLVLWHVSILHSFSWLSTIPLYGHAAIWLLWTFGLLRPGLLGTLGFKFLFELLFLILWGIHLGMKLLGPMNIVLPFKEPPSPISVFVSKGFFSFFLTRGHSCAPPSAYNPRLFLCHNGGAVVTRPICPLGL